MGQVLTVGTTLTCPHSAPVVIASSNTRVLLNGQPANTSQDNFTIGTCAFAVGSKPQPCTRVEWTGPARKVTVSGQPLVLSDSTAMCFSADNIPQGPPRVLVVQPRVKAQ
jgi:hypothetical protein